MCAAVEDAEIGESRGVVAISAESGAVLAIKTVRIAGLAGERSRVVVGRAGAEGVAIG